MMARLVITGAAFLTAVMSFEIAHFDTNNMIEFDTVPIHEISIPYYPYHEDNFEKRYEVQKPFKIQTEIQETVPPILPSKQEAVATKLGVVSTIINNICNLVKSVIHAFFSSAPGLIFGSILTFGICKLTPFCGKISHIKSLFNLEDINSFATSEKIDLATSLLQHALKKFT